mgnify:CR=1 FL=1
MPLDSVSRTVASCGSPNSSTPPSASPRPRRGWRRPPCSPISLRRLEPREVPIAVAYLSGRLRQGRIGLGWSSIRSATDETKRLDEPPSLFDDAPGVPSEPARIDRRRSRVRRDRGAVRFGIGEGQDARAACAARSRVRNGAAVPSASCSASCVRARWPARWRTRSRAQVTSRCPRFAARSCCREASRRSRSPCSRKAARCARALPFGHVPAGGADACAAGDRSRRRRCARLGTAALEHKLDGARVQVHRRRPRGARLLAAAQRRHRRGARGGRGRARPAAARGGSSTARWWRSTATGRPQPFQITMRRFGRTLDVADARRAAARARAASTRLRLDDADLLDAPQRERFAALAARAPKLVGAAPRHR